MNPISLALGLALLTLASSARAEFVGCPPHQLCLAQAEGGGAGAPDAPTSETHKRRKKRKKKPSRSSSNPQQAPSAAAPPAAGGSAPAPAAGSAGAASTQGASPSVAADPAARTTPGASSSTTEATASPAASSDSTPSTAPRAGFKLLLAPKVGYFLPTSQLKGALFGGLELGLLTPALDQGLALVVDVDWYRPKASGSITDPRLPAGDTNYGLGQSEVGVLLSAVYRANDVGGSGFTPYAGAGPGFFYHRAAITGFGSTNIETEGMLGFQAVGGAEYRLGPGGIFGEVRYHFARVNLASTGRANSGGFLALGLGYRLMLF